MHGNTGIMLDLETLATEPGAGVIEVGFCIFNYKVLQTREQIQDTGQFYTMTLTDNLRQRMAIDPKTLNWWDYEQAGLPSFSKRSMQASLALVTDALNEYWRKGIRDVWAKPALFDVPILQEAMDALNIERPLCLQKENFRHWQCFATLSRAIKLVSPEFFLRSDFKKKATHNALNDAVDQAVQANTILTILPEWKDRSNQLDFIRTDKDFLYRENQRLHKIYEKLYVSHQKLKNKRGRR